MNRATESIPVGLVEDDAPFRRYVAQLLAATGRYRVEIETAEVDAALVQVAKLKPRVLLLDLRLPGVSGAQAVERFLAQDANLKVVMLTGVDRDDALLECIRAGASGYLLKGIGSDDLVACVDEAVDGGAPMSPGIARRVLELLRRPAIAPAAASPSAGAKELCSLSPREHEVLTLVASGLSDKEVATRLGIAVSTVKNQLASIYGKWRVRSRTEAVVRLLRGEGR